MTATLSSLAVSAHEIMDENPSESGWQRLETRACGGRHPRTPGDGRLIYWRRRRDYFDRHYRDLPVEDDQALIVAEKVPSALCATRRFHDVNIICNCSPLVAAGLGVAWTFDGQYGPGMLVHLNAANGRWVWQLTDDQSCCGGYLARWRD